MTSPPLAFTPASLARLVEETAAYEEISYAQAICNICADREIDPVDVVPILTSEIRDKLQREAVRARLIPATPSLY